MADAAHSCSPNSVSPSREANGWWLLVWAALLITTGIWAYWGTLSDLATVWSTQPDYSHGYLVFPLSLLLLAMRWDRRPSAAPRMAWWGLLVMASSVAIRFGGSRWVTDTADGYSLIVWLAGAVALLGGRPWLRWSLPCILFLAFMVPLPYRLETWLSVPLQRVAASLSGFLLQLLGQPAFAYGTTITLGERVLEVERECSGLRIFVGIFALAFAFIIAGRRELWTNALLLASILPIALLANAVRIVISGLLFQLVSSSAAQHFSHDFAGWLMILLAAVFLASVLWYLNRLVPERRVLSVSEVLGRHPAESDGQVSDRGYDKVFAPR